jgi:SAM-dependent methyltransferase
MANKETNWEQRWQTKETQWDLGGVTPALKEELEKLPMTSGEALVPGCGAAYDLSAIATRFEFVTGIDLAPSAVEIAREKNKNEKIEVVLGNFFEHQFPKKFDFVFDYTFFCAIQPTRRSEWGARMGDLVKPGGKLLTLVFPIDEANAFNPEAKGPPFPVSIAAYEKVLLANGFKKVSERQSEASVKPRRQMERVVWWERTANAPNL